VCLLTLFLYIDIPTKDGYYTHTPYDSFVCSNQDFSYLHRINSLGLRENEDYKGTSHSNRIII